MSIIDAEFQNFLIKIEKQYLCCLPLQLIQWDEIVWPLSWEEQKDLLDATINSPLNQQFPVKLSYQLNFLKELISLLETFCLEIRDEFYESYCEVQHQLSQDNTNKYAYKHYLLNKEVHFTIRESKSFVADGTTGLCSWQASLALSDFLIQHKEELENKTILELGAGTGLCGFITFKMCNPQDIILSDGSPQCVNLMAESVKRNFPELNEKEDLKFSSPGSNSLQCCVIPWNLIDKVKEVTELKPEIILAADVVYDNSCFEDLSFAIDFVFKLSENAVQMFLAATVRNEDTLNEFLEKLRALSFIVSEQPMLQSGQGLLYWDDSTPIKILKITR